MHVLFASSEIHPLAKTGGLPVHRGALLSGPSHFGGDARRVAHRHPSALERAVARWLLHLSNDDEPC
jgi:glycogen synthase